MGVAKPLLIWIPSDDQFFFVRQPELIPGGPPGEIHVIGTMDPIEADIDLALDLAIDARHAVARRTELLARLLERIGRMLDRRDGFIRPRGRPARVN